MRKRYLSWLQIPICAPKSLAVWVNAGARPAHFSPAHASASILVSTILQTLALAQASLLTRIDAKAVDDFLRALAFLGRLHNATQPIA